MWKSPEPLHNRPKARSIRLGHGLEVGLGDGLGADDHESFSTLAGRRDPRCRYVRIRAVEPGQSGMSRQSSEPFIGEFRPVHVQPFQRWKGKEGVDRTIPEFGVVETKLGDSGELSQRSDPPIGQTSPGQIRPDQNRLQSIKQSEVFVGERGLDQTCVDFKVRVKFLSRSLS